MFDKPKGGTELMMEELKRRLPESVFDRFSIFNYPDQADHSKRLIYWNQLSYDQQAVNFLNYKENIDKIEHFVFVSNWQFEQFRKRFNIPGERSTIIENAHLGVRKKLEFSDKIKCVYTSTPWRGLDVLLKAFEMLDDQNVTLDIYSSTKIYGNSFSQSEEQKYEPLYDWAEQIKNVNYIGNIPNQELREKLNEYDILVYPCTFEETSCISVIEAISCGLFVVTSSLGALPETCQGNCNMYAYINDKEIHAEIFKQKLQETIENIRQGVEIRHFRNRDDYHERFSWETRIKEWKKLISKLK